ncbi:MAG TPA: YceI family protein, partial [Agriterribacter sp.]|nr:YceI family protein [Agriterribacter sp.]
MKQVKTTSRLLSLFAALLLISNAVFAQTVWQADPAHAKVTFSTVHNAISDVEGLFNKFDAKITASRQDFGDAVFNLTIAVKSIDTEIKMRDDHLR